LLFKGVSIREAVDVLAASIRLVGVWYKKEKTYAAKTLKLLVKVDGALTRAMLDIGVKVNVIT